MSSQSNTERLKRLERLANLLDSRFTVVGIQIGWDSILGLVPGVGDVATAAPTAFAVVEGARMGARKRVLGRMVLNGAVDLFIGGIPILGDVFDLFFKSHRRNVALLSAEIEGQDVKAAEGKSELLRRGESGSAWH